MATKAEAKVKDLAHESGSERCVGEANDDIDGDAHRQPVHVDRDEHWREVHLVDLLENVGLESDGIVARANLSHITSSDGFELPVKLDRYA